MAYVCSDILDSMGQDPLEAWSWQRSGQDWFDAFTTANPDWNNYLPIAQSECDGGITLAATDVTPAGLTIVCTQKDGILTGELMTGSPYFVQKYEDGEWVSLETPDGTAWTILNR